MEQHPSGCRTGDPGGDINRSIPSVSRPIKFTGLSRCFSLVSSIRVPKSQKTLVSMALKVGQCGTMEAFKIRSEMKVASWFSGNQFPRLLVCFAATWFGSSLIFSNQFGPNPVCCTEAYEIDLTQFD